MWLFNSWFMFGLLMVWLVATNKLLTKINFIFSPNSYVICSNCTLLLLRPVPQVSAGALEVPEDRGEQTVRVYARAPPGSAGKMLDCAFLYLLNALIV